MDQKAVICGINGPVVKATGASALQMLEMVQVGNSKLIGEVISLSEKYCTIQVYEETSGLKIGEPVYSTGSQLSLTLGPGIIGEVFDGIQRPLETLKKEFGDFLGRGIETFNLNKDKEWKVDILVKEGQVLSGGQFFAEVQETDLVRHRIMLHPDKSGKVVEIVKKPSYKVLDTVIKIENEFGDIEECNLVQYWPVRLPRPFKVRKSLEKPLITGQRIIDTFFPIAKGGAAAVPGGFGTGKTMTQHQLAKWSDADIIVYIGCGERGNEITEVLEDFPKLIDPKSGKPLMERTVLIANTSNMPVAAREASIYTGITIAEYFRDMGYHVAIMADSTSRWAEALREISGRLEEMPAEEGFPPYLPSRLSQFYERAGYVVGLDDKEGSVSIIGAVSPQGGDFSEPVTQNTKRFIRCFWALDRSLAYARHYPAIQWLESYSEYTPDLEKWFNQNVDENFYENRKEAMALLQEESNLMEIVKLIGADVLPENQKLTLEVTKLIRLGFLQQNAFHDVDTFVPLVKQYRMLDTILYLYHKAKQLVGFNVPVSRLRQTGVFDEVVKMRYNIDNLSTEPFDRLKKRINDFYQEVADSYKGFERMDIE